MGFFSGMLSCFNPSSSARVNDKQNVKEEEPSLSSNHKLKSKSSASKPPIPISYFPVNSRLSYLWYIWTVDKLLNYEKLVGYWDLIRLKSCSVFKSRLDCKARRYVHQLFLYFWCLIHLLIDYGLRFKLLLLVVSILVYGTYLWFCISNEEILVTDCVCVHLKLKWFN